MYFGGNVQGIAPLLVRNAFDRLKKERGARSHIYFILDTREIWEGRKMGGGDFHAALGVKRLIEQYPGPVTTVIYHEAFSAGSYLSQFGDRRFITKKSTIRFDQAAYHWPKEKRFTARSVWEPKYDLLLVDAMQLLFLTARKQPITEIIQLFKAEASVDAKTAKKLGLVDKIIPEPKDLKHLVRYLSRRRT
jgi:ATP-dependent protease ClpP protease subunit